MKELLVNSLKSSFGLWINVLKMMIPISLGVKVLEEFGLIQWVGALLEPIMVLVGLPGVMGLVWAITLFTNLWAGALLFVVLAGTVDMTSAQVTVLGIMMLMAHGLPIELRMVQKCGVSVLFSLALRVFSAIILAGVFNHIFTYYGLLSEPAQILIGNVDNVDTSLTAWIYHQLESYVFVFIMLAFLVFLMDVLKKYGLIHKIGVLLSPYLSLMGVSKKCAPITFLGMTLGLVYGGALLLRELEKNDMDEDDVLISVTSMNLFHSLIEDSIIIFLMGGALFWIVVVRFIFTAIIMKLITTAIKINDAVLLKIIKA